MPPPLVQHPPLIRRNSPELHLYGVITLGSWQNLPATKKSDVSSEGEQIIIMEGNTAIGRHDPEAVAQSLHLDP